MSVKFEVSFYDIFEVDSEEEIHDAIRQYIKDCVDYNDIDAFRIEKYEPEETK